jgi:hypothetical protein
MAWVYGKADLPDPERVMMRFVIVDGESCGVFVFFDEVVGKVGRKISAASLRSAAAWAGVGHRMLFVHPCTPAS